MKHQDKNTFVKLIEIHQGIIINLCRVYFQRTEDQHDARQDVILQLWKAFPSFREDSKISTWIYKVSLNTLLNKLRNEKKLGKLVPIQQAEYLKNTTHFLVDDDLQLLKQIINSLNEEDKALLILQLEGYRHKEIAEILNTSVSNVSTRIHRIKNELKSTCKSLFHEPQ